MVTLQERWHQQQETEADYQLRASERQAAQRERQERQEVIAARIGSLLLSQQMGFTAWNAPGNLTYLNTYELTPIPAGALDDERFGFISAYAMRGIVSRPYYQSVGWALQLPRVAHVEGDVVRVGVRYYTGNEEGSDTQLFRDRYLSVKAPLPPRAKILSQLESDLDFIESSIETLADTSVSE